MNLRHLALVLVAATTACGDDTERASTFKPNCTPGVVSADAKLPAGMQADGSAILPGGRRISPLGRTTVLGGFPMGARVLPGGKHALVTDGGYSTNYLTVVDLATGTMTHRETFSGSRALFWGIAVRPSDNRIFVSGGGHDDIYVYAYDEATGTLTSPMAPIAITGPNNARDLIAGLALSNDGQTLYAVAQASSALIAIDANTGTERGAWLLAADHPHDIAIAPTLSGRNEAYITAWGGNQLIIVDLAAPFGMGGVAARIDTGKSPGAVHLLPTADKVLVPNSGADTLTLIDLASRTIERTVSVARAAALPVGATPNHVALSPDGSRVYVTDAGENAIDVLDATTLMSKGRIPTAWWPTGVAVAADGSLVITAGKGLGGGPITEDEGSGFLEGTASIVSPAPTDGELAAHTVAVEMNATRPRRNAALPTCPEGQPRMNVLPLQKGDATPIKHVFVIMRENKTYDAELGDLAGSNGDPSLVLFGERFTPNLHEFARKFVVYDNFYSNAEASIQGHVWGVSATTTDFTEKAWLTTWGRGTRTSALFASDISAPKDGFIWQHLERQNVPYYNFGEVVGTFIGMAKPDQPRFDERFPGVIYNMDVTDKKKGDYVASLVLGDQTWPPFSFILLPNNHTQGTSPGKPTPGSYVADNDEGTGVIVDAISKSKFWKESIIFIFEDDPQDGGDHVEGHRSPLVVVSPWVKRGYVSSAHHDVPAMWATIERLLGIDPMSLYTFDAAPLFDMFTDTPDFTPVSYIPRLVPEAVNGRSSPLSAESSRMDFSTPDNAPGLGRILWKAMKGTDAPWHFMPIPTEEPEEEAEEEYEEAWEELELPRYDGTGPPP